MTGDMYLKIAEEWRMQASAAIEQQISELHRCSDILNSVSARANRVQHEETDWEVLQRFYLTREHNQLVHRSCISQAERFLPPQRLHLRR